MERSKLAELYTSNDLEESDIFTMKMGGKQIPIIKREGIEKIQAKQGINITYEMTSIAPDNKHVVIKGVGTMTDKDGVVTTIESYGESSPANTTQKYPIAMAEKRALSRVVLKLAGFYALGAFGEDEAEEFKE